MYHRMLHLWYLHFRLEIETCVEYVVFMRAAQASILLGGGREVKSG
jgi:hypothetical protein